MTETTTPADLLALVRRAINDPGKTVPREDGESVGNWSARAVLADLAQLLDPGDLPARMADAIALVRNGPASGGRAWYRTIAERQDILAEVHAAASVRWEAGAQAHAEAARLRNRVTALEANGAELLARAEDAERRAAYAEGQLSARRDHETRWELEHQKRTEAEAAIQRVRAEVTRLATSDTIGVIRQHVIDRLTAALDGGE